MTNINLLPWREGYRREQNLKFIYLCIVFVVIAMGIGYLWYLVVSANIQQQEIRNNLLQREITQLSEKVKEIQTLKKRRKELEVKIDIIQNLQNKRSMIVHYFDEMAKLVPEGIYLTTFSRKDELFPIQGVAKSNKSISILMRNLEKSASYERPELKKVVKGEFMLTVKAKSTSTTAQQQK